MKASVTSPFRHDVDNCVDRVMQLASCPRLLTLLFNECAGRMLLTVLPRLLEQLCKKLPGLWRSAIPSGPVSSIP